VRKLKSFEGEKKIIWRWEAPQPIGLEGNSIQQDPINYHISKMLDVPPKFL